MSLILLPKAKSRTENYMKSHRKPSSPAKNYFEFDAALIVRPAQAKKSVMQPAPTLGTPVPRSVPRFFTRTATRFKKV